VAGRQVVAAAQGRGVSPFLVFGGSRFFGACRVRSALAVAACSSRSGDEAKATNGRGNDEGSSRLGMHHLRSLQQAPPAAARQRR